MKNQKIVLTLISLVGMLFSGYLSLTKIIAGYCPLTEGCPLFLGYPACYTGFILFFTLFILSLLNKTKIIQTVSLVSIVFALYSTYIDLFFPSCPGGVCKYSLLIPTCIYGLVMYIAIFIFSKNSSKE